MNTENKANIEKKNLRNPLKGRGVGGWRAKARRSDKRAKARLPDMPAGSRWPIRENSGLKPAGSI